MWNNSFVPRNSLSLDEILMKIFERIKLKFGIISEYPLYGIKF